MTDKPTNENQPFELQPVSLSKTEQRELEIEWSDGHTQTISFGLLRKSCQCANCMEKRKADDKNSTNGMLNVLSPAEVLPLDVVQMRPAGNYAYNIQFSDGHSSGLFTFELLRSLG